MEPSWTHEYPYQFQCVRHMESTWDSHYKTGVPEECVRHQCVSGKSSLTSLTTVMIIMTPRVDLGGAPSAACLFVQKPDASFTNQLHKVQYPNSRIMMPCQATMRLKKQKN